MQPKTEKHTKEKLESKDKRNNNHFFSPSDACETCECGSDGHFVVGSCAVMACDMPQCPEGQRVESRNPDACCSYHCVSDQGEMPFPKGPFYCKIYDMILELFL